MKTNVIYHYTKNRLEVLDASTYKPVFSAKGPKWWTEFLVGFKNSNWRVERVWLDEEATQTKEKK